MQTGNGAMEHLYVPLHIHSFATEREEEPNSCTPGKNFLNVRFQQSEQRNKQNKRGINSNSHGQS